MLKPVKNVRGSVTTLNVANRRAHPDDSFMAFCLMGVRHHRPIPDRGKIVEVPSGRYRLLYQMGGS